MDWIQAIVLGIVQGLAEFLPISSTAHLTLVGKAFGLVDPANPEAWTAFLAIVQLGTLAAVIVYFWKDIVDLVRAALVGLALRARGKRIEDAATRTHERVAWLVALATVPIVVLGLALKKVIEGKLTKSLWVIAGSLVAMAILLAIAERVGRRRTSLDQLDTRQALVVGSAQVLALVPGASRSGTTIAGGLFAGLDRASAARFSFLLSIPAVGGSAVFELISALKAGGFQWGPIIVATLAAAVSGYAAIWGLLRYLQRHSTMVFVWYRLALGGLILALLSFGVLQAY